VEEGGVWLICKLIIWPLAKYQRSFWREFYHDERVSLLGGENGEEGIEARKAGSPMFSRPDFLGGLLGKEGRRKIAYSPGRKKHFPE